MNKVPTLSADSLKKVYKILGYSFKNSEYLITALTHRSLKNSFDSYERLEFFGDKILGFIVAEKLFQNSSNADEGVLSATLSALVNRKFLSELMGDLDVGKFIIMTDECRQAGLADNENILGDIAESILGAIYLDGGMEAASGFVYHIIGAYFEKPPSALDAKSRLQNWCQARAIALPNYVEAARTGSDHDPHFEFTVSADDKVATGTGTNKRDAMQEAAHHFWKNYINNEE